MGQNHALKLSRKFGEYISWVLVTWDRVFFQRSMITDEGDSVSFRAVGVGFLVREDEPGNVMRICSKIL
jgi:hypothetical protein